MKKNQTQILKVGEAAHMIKINGNI